MKDGRTVHLVHDGEKHVVIVVNKKGDTQIEYHRFSKLVDAMRTFNRLAS